MKSYTTISSPSIEVIDPFFQEWLAIEGNAAKTPDNFYQFLAPPSILRGAILFYFRESAPVHLKANIVLHTINTFCFP